MTVLDASAVLTLVHDEPGSDTVAEVDVTRVRELLSAAGVVIEALSAADAELAGAMRSLDGGRGSGRR